MDEFKFPNFVDDRNINIANKMREEESVSIHIRRNEYVTNNLSVVSDRYYKQAIDIINHRVNDPHYYVFSDDLDYCQNLLAGMEHTLIDWNRKNQSFRDMQLMTYCKHNIIANSTFSFWGAYLGTNEDKMVIAPNLSWGNLKHPFARGCWMILDAK